MPVCYNRYRTHVWTPIKIKKKKKKKNKQKKKQKQKQKQNKTKQIEPKKNWFSKKKKIIFFSFFWMTTQLHIAYCLIQIQI